MPARAVSRTSCERGGARPEIARNGRYSARRVEALATIGHLAVGLAGGRLFAPAVANRRELLTAMMALSAFALAPDADVIAFALGIPYAATWGHRGAAHSLVFALAAGTVAGALLPLYGSRLRAMLAFGLVMASHGLLDALTSGGLGIALLWPASDARLFAPWRPLPVAPIGMGMLSRRGLSVLLHETAIFMPLLLYALWPRRASRR
jgi:inner membrane protein